MVRDGRQKMPLIAAPIYPSTGLLANETCPCQELCKNHPFLPFGLLADFVTWMTGIEKDSKRLRETFRSNCWRDENWLRKFEVMRNKYLSEFYGFEKFPDMDKVIKRARSFKPKSDVEKQFVKRMQDFVSDYRMCQLELSDDDLKKISRKRTEIPFLF